MICPRNRALLWPRLVHLLLLKPNSPSRWGGGVGGGELEGGSKKEP